MMRAGRILGVLVLLVVALSAWPALASLGRSVVHQPGRLVDPGPLASPHSSDPELSDCEACHSLTTSIPDEHCLRCHTQVAERIDEGRGYHGRELTGRCLDCHVDHRDHLVDLDRDAFDHDLASFALAGRHADVKCEACHADHGPFHYMGVKFDRCTSCHEDPHQDSLAPRACRDCHVADGWENPSLTFDHRTQSRFAMDALHDTLECSACHDGLHFRPAPVDCAACHTFEEQAMEGRIEAGATVEQWGPSPHAGKAACSDCHDLGDSQPSEESYGSRCAGCHTEHYAGLYRDRTEHLRALAEQLEVRLASDSEAGATGRARLDAVLAVGHHNYVEAERRLQGLLTAQDG